MTANGDVVAAEESTAAADRAALSFALLRLCQTVVRGDIQPDAAVGQLRELLREKAEGRPILVDVLQAVDTHVQTLGGDPQKDTFRRLCKLLCAAKLVPEDVLRVSLETLSDPSLQSKSIKIRTRIYYKQLKFNLFREESEGYAKLISELCGPDCLALPLTAVLQRIRCLIGQFNLDPNRVNDVILECFECNLERSEFFLDLLRAYNASKDDLRHLMGFKFSFYQKSGEDVPESLYRLSALLLHHKMVDLRPLCAYLTPKLDALVMDQKRRTEEMKKRAKKMEAASVSSVTADAPSAAAPADAAAVATAAAASAAGGGWSQSEKFDTTDEEETALLAVNQKLGLLCALLEIGSWPLAKDLLDRMPEFYAVGSCRRIAEALIDLIQRVIDDFYKLKCPELTPFLDLPTEKTDTSVSTLFAAPESVRSWTELAERVFPMLQYLGPHVGQRPVFTTRLIRLLVAYCKENPFGEYGSRVSKRTEEDSTGEDSEKDVEMKGAADGDKAAAKGAEWIGWRVVDMCDEALVPAMSLVGSCAVAEELWALVGQLPYAARYRLYGRWKSVHTLRHGALLARKHAVFGRTRYVMKRLSKETTKLVGRQLAKLSHSHPVVVFDYLLNQIQTFENLIGPVVESMKLLSSLEFDVLSYCIIEHLASPAKQKLKVSDATISPWMQSLATFVGTVFKKFNMELSGVLQYVANQLKDGKSFDLLVLREIIQNMSGVESTTGLTQDQLEAWFGGDILRQEGGSFGQVKNVRKATNRLRDALFQEDLVVGLCILMAQQRGSIVFKEGEGIHLKLVGQMLDQCHDTLVQFGSFLSVNLKADDYAKRMPWAPDLIGRYRLAPDAALFLARPIYANAITSKFERDSNRLKKSTKAPPTMEKKRQLFAAAFESVVGGLCTELGPAFGDVSELDARLLVTFWLLSINDLHPATGAYGREADKLKLAVRQLDDTIDPRDKRQTKERDRLVQLQAKLGDEERRRVEHVEFVRGCLRADKDRWFGRKGAASRVALQLLQHCLVPRACFSDQDALFCAKFVEMVHSERAAAFPTLVLFDRIFIDLTPYLVALSENEAHCFGRFLNAILAKVMQWHQNKALFDTECQSYPGFMTKFRSMDGSHPNQDRGLDFESFRNIVLKWHTKITRIILSMFNTSSYVPVRNSLILLIKILNVYPLLQQQHSVIEKRVCRIRDDEKEKRQDLSVLAASYWGNLRMRKVSLVTDDEFCKRPQRVVARPAVQQQKILPAAQTTAAAAASPKRPADSPAKVATSAPARAVITAATPPTAAAAAVSNKTPTAASAATSKAPTSASKAPTAAAAAPTSKAPAAAAAKAPPTPPTTTTAAVKRAAPAAPSQPAATDEKRRREERPKSIDSVTKAAQGKASATLTELAPGPDANSTVVAGPAANAATTTSGAPSRKIKLVKPPTPVEKSSKQSIISAAASESTTPTAEAKASSKGSAAAAPPKSGSDDRDGGTAAVVSKHRVIVPPSDPLPSTKPATATSVERRAASNGQRTDGRGRGSTAPRGRRSAPGDEDGAAGPEHHQPKRRAPAADAGTVVAARRTVAARQSTSGDRSGAAAAAAAASSSRTVKLGSGATASSSPKDRAVKKERRGGSKTREKDGGVKRERSSRPSSRSR